MQPGNAKRVEPEASLSKPETTDETKSSETMQPEKTSKSKKSKSKSKSKFNSAQPSLQDIAYCSVRLYCSVLRLIYFTVPEHPGMLNLKFPVWESPGKSWNSDLSPGISVLLENRVDKNQFWKLVLLNTPVHKVIFQFSFGVEALYLKQYCSLGYISPKSAGKFVFRVQ